MAFRKQLFPSLLRVYKNIGIILVLVLIVFFNIDYLGHLIFLIIPFILIIHELFCLNGIENSGKYLKIKPRYSMPFMIDSVNKDKVDYGIMF